MMNTFDLSIRLRAFRDTAGFTDPEAAAALGLRYAQFCRLKNQGTRLDVFSNAEMERRLSGHSPREAIDLDAFARRVRQFRLEHGLTRKQAALAMGTTIEQFKAWECGRVRNKLGVPEIVSRLELPIDSHIIGHTERENFAEKVRAWRKSGRLSQREASRALGVSSCAVSLWEIKAQFPRAQTLRKILPILDAPPPAKPAKPKPENPAKPPREHRSRHDPEFGPRLRAWRKASRLTQAEASVMLGIPHKTILTCYERGRVMPNTTRLASIEQMIAAGPALTAQTHAEVSFPQRLRAWRHARGLTRQQACAELGIPDCSTLSHYEIGSYCPRPDRLAQIEAVLADTDALTPALADIEQSQAKLVRAQTLRARLEHRLRRAERWIERLQTRIERRQREVASLRAQS